MAEKKIGKVTHYYDRIGVAIIDLIAPIKLGDEIVFRHKEAEVDQTVDSIQIDRSAVESAKAGDVIGMETHQPVRAGTEVYLK